MRAVSLWRSLFGRAGVVKVDHLLLTAGIVAMALAVVTLVQYDSETVTRSIVSDGD